MPNMTAIEKYAALKADIAEAEAWAALIGKPYSGGTGTLSKADVQMVITYKQTPSSDDKNRAPKALAGMLEAEVIQRSTNIINGAINAMKAELAKQAKKAQDEYAALMADAGVPIPP